MTSCAGWDITIDCDVSTNNNMTVLYHFIKCSLLLLLFLSYENVTSDDVASTENRIAKSATLEKEFQGMQRI